MKDYIKLENLEVYQLACDLADMAWQEYKLLDKENKFLFGKQYLQAFDSIGANIAEGYGRFHYLDKAKFYYNARGSLFESLYWNRTFFKREVVDEQKHLDFENKLNSLNAKLNNFIKFTKENGCQNS